MMVSADVGGRAPEKSVWFSKDSEDVPACIHTHAMVVQVCQSILALWDNAFSVSHKNGLPIVLREALAALGMHLRCREGVTGPTRFLTLVDSTSLLGAFSKRHSNSGRLNAYCGALASIQACMESRALFARVSTNLNPADGPARSVPQL